MRIRQQLTSTKHTYGRNNKKLYITVHQTGNTSRGANAAAHANLQSRGNVRAAAWHWQVDDKEAVQSFTHDWQLWQSGDGRGDGNLNSIAIEMCVNSDGNYKAALANLETLIKKIMKDEGIPASRVVQHNHWSGKNCPAQIRSRGEWSRLKDSLGSKTSKPKPAPKPKPPAKKSVAAMASEVIAGKHGNGHGNRRKSLGVSASVYEQVRAEVNRRAGIKTPAAKAKPKPKPKPKAKPKKSISQMATEVIQGKHGNGHARRRKSLGISAADYKKVRAEVNRRVG